ncbi:YTH domain-containing protein ECT4 isoform X1 [Ricinus communis]|nr:YTH domain-containing protein ECT4 isoform X1 [Ricinus communis]XP_048235094.1 YTH domain-containing protein ECT4 isoform X1 [Ricinus communis]|eukprot:XP_015574750.1 YTH domain-containing family protein 2 isoform X1 [Ricinus communis]
MDMHNISGHGNTDNFLIHGAENPLLTSPLLEQVEAMYNEGAPEFFLDQGLYYPTAANFGYYCTGFESPSEWEDHRRIFGVDGPDIQYAGAQTESLPYVYYTPSYGYAESPYNPYNPYIPGAMVGMDGSYVGAQQYYPITPYQDTVSSPGYFPVVVQPDFIPNNLTEPLLDTGVAFTNRPDTRGLKHGLGSSSAAFPKSQIKPTSIQTKSLSKISEGQRANVGTSKQSLTHGSVSSGSYPTPAASRLLQGRDASGSNQLLPHSNQLKVAVPANNGFSDFGSSALGQTTVDKLRPKIHVSRTLHDANGRPDALGEQNRGPRTNKSKNQLAVKAFTNKVGDSNAQGNIIIYTDQFNKDDFPVDYVDAKFFVIKSYSEDDVHKSIKYNVWSSTPHGNKKLQSAYEDAQKIAAGKLRACPIFLFFSVNASGQFCGVAEMIGSVDFLNDMDFWQQDKWSGSFPVKWHIIKDVSNSSFRHIILENNENKPVTNSRDTQEILYKQGLEMLKIFKNHVSKTSLLDDFMYYENRQRIMQEEKARFAFKRLETPFLVPVLDPAHKLNSVIELPPSKTENTIEQNGSNSMKNTEASAIEQGSSNSDVSNTIVERGNSEIVNAGDDIESGLKIGLLSINPKQAEHKPSSATSSVATVDSADIVTVGSVPIQVNGFAECSGFLRVGSIPLDPKALQQEKGDPLSKSRS